VGETKARERDESEREREREMEKEGETKKLKNQYGRREARNMTREFSSLGNSTKLRKPSFMP